MKLHELSPAPGSTDVAKRKGRGPASGNGKTAGRGHKGQKARSGGGVRPGFEGGQMPLQRRMPKRGFTNARFKKVYANVNLSDLNRFEAGAVVDVAALKEKGLLKQLHDGVKVLSDGELTKNLEVRLQAYSAAAKEKIEAAGGRAEVVDL
ncbi:MAG: 50S ribosomal protein L15 [Clostridiales bacterium]|nr:50S ribosomal protein L15 [Clostridiales bacterium]